jgi:hypothetical protein
MCSVRRPAAGTSNTRGSRGVESDAVSSGMALILQGANGAGNQATPLDAIAPLNGAVPFMTDYGTQFTTGVRHEDGDSRLIYLNFALEAAHSHRARWVWRTRWMCISTG